MKIALIAAGNSIHTQRWALALSARGHEVHVITCINHVYRSDMLCGITIKPLRYGAPLGYYLNASELKAYVKQEKFDVINVHYASGYGTLGRLAGLSNALLNVWGSDVYTYPYQGLFNMRTIKKNLKFYKYLASTSKCMAEQVKKLVNRDDDIYITPFGVDVSKFKPIEGLKDNNIFLFGTVKTLSPKYGIEQSINAFVALYKRLCEEGQSDIAEKLRYEIYGKGELYGYLSDIIRSAKMSEKIKLMGYIPNNELPLIYNKFDVSVSVSVSDSESFGVAIVEAMACGLPCVVSDADGLKEVVTQTGGGIIVPKGDVAATSNAMYDMLMSKEKRVEYGKKGREGVKKYYDWEKNVDYMVSIYEEINK